MAHDMMDLQIKTMPESVACGVHNALSITCEDGCRVEIRTDGTIRYGENYKPDEAARTFWNALACMVPTELRQQAKVIASIRAALQEIRDMHDGEEDVIDGDYGIPEPNRAMRVNQIIDAVL